ncbi:hypothetical protein Poli38472_003481 [Pythium oligandrum]|uniref:Uncharacterized protein n=1 Tax=Pythium oligandrum TaxID=41045 RepID=A0A8K1FCT2_PYTOL|nr:hypothetical protein Poli38472_003481 [Pythium oligandrum]|eukprot:TMW57556.1 hypothetical protein Poli38472_003481 [Pythium oligandrum]
MGLRSRQRRRAGVDTAASFDIETLQHRGVSLEEHLQASRRDIDDFNFAWKHAVAIAGLLLALYELALLYQVVFVPRHAASSLVLCVLFKLLAVASLLSTRAYIQTGASASLGASGFFTAAYVLVYVCCVLVLGLSFSLVQVSPIAVVYCVVSHTALRLIGDNTKAEVARAQQLQKLEQLASQGKL